MAKYVHLFETQADFTAAYNGSEYQEPWVSYTIQNEEVDRLVEAGRETGDPEKRMEYYDELEKLLGPISPYATLYYDNVNVAGNAKVIGFTPDPNGYHRLRNVEVGA